MNFASEEIRSLVARLRRDGWVCDEQVLGSYAFEHRENDIYADIREAGYDEPLESGGCVGEGGGRTIYYLYASERLSYEEAGAQAQEWLREND